MKWKKKKPTARQRRIRTKFAWWPKEMDDGTMVWFGWYTTIEVWDEPDAGVRPGRWELVGLESM